MKRLLSMLGLSSVTLVPSLALAAPAVADKADNAFMMICTALVLFMTLPGIALFYGGLLRGKNVLSMLTQVTVTFALVCVLWVLYGYSLAFSEGNAVFGGFETAMLKGIGIDSVTGSISQMIHVAFQASFACITVALVVGGFAERIRFSAVLIFAILWFTLSYLPIAHMVWGGGYLATDGALDFAGGTVVHINAASAGLIGAYLLGKRAGFGKEAFKPHNLPMVFTGASILYIGWFGFNAGSASAANGIAALAFLNTVVATAGAILSWTFAEWVLRGKPSLLGACSGMIAGLVAVTPAAASRPGSGAGQPSTAAGAAGALLPDVSAAAGGRAVGGSGARGESTRLIPGAAIAALVSFPRTTSRQPACAMPPFCTFSTRCAPNQCALFNPFKVSALRCVAAAPACALIR